MHTYETLEVIANKIGRILVPCKCSSEATDLSTSTICLLSSMAFHTLEDSVDGEEGQEVVPESIEIPLDSCGEGDGYGNI
ncbi:hypothetical protein L1887_34011 [Cichorium endivia]|nr:hypothetical protein L1887_34011 [Cichorium endivia]